MSNNSVVSFKKNIVNVDGDLIYYLVADIGGTNCRLSLIDSNYSIIKKKSISHLNFYDELFDFYNKYSAKFNISKICIGVAGLVKDSCVKLTNVDLFISLSKLKSLLSFDEIYLVNDYELMAYSLNNVAELSSVKIISKSTSSSKSTGPKLLVGVGTGLGASVLVGNSVLRSEAHLLELNFPISDSLTSIEDVVSGRGIINIYKKLHCSVVSIDSAVCDVLVQNFFSRTFAKLLKNLTYIYLPSEIYLYGGVLQKSSFLLGKFFLSEFFRHYDPSISEFLKTIDIKLIEDYDFSLKAGVFFLKTTV